MKIAIFGFYNALNAGDDRIQHAVTYLLGGRDHEIIFLPHDKEPPIAFLKSVDWILIGGGGLVFSHHGIWVNMRKWMRKSKAKIGVLGLGVNHLPPPLSGELNDLISLSSFFFVRDRRSWELLGESPDVRIAPDLAWLIPQESPAGLTIEKSFEYAINLVPCPWKDFDPDPWVEQLPLEQCTPFPLYCTPRQDLGLLRRYFPGMHDHFSLTPLLASRMLLGARFHAVVFSIQLGIPFIAIAYDHKVRELCSEASLAEYCLETDQAGLLKQKCQEVKRNESAILRQMHEFDSRQRSQAITMMNEIREIMKL